MIIYSWNSVSSEIDEIDESNEERGNTPAFPRLPPAKCWMVKG